MPTVVVPAASDGATARQLASSHSAISRGVPSTSTVPDPSARAVSASPTDHLRLAAQARRHLHGRPR